jgi:4-amino-4-deoxy-L-arabinose transferase-like glycosyltransferase
MNILLIVISFILTLVNVYIWKRKPHRYKTGKLRIAFIKTAIIYGLIITALTEILSIWRSLNFVSVTVFWNLFLVLNLVVLRIKFSQRFYWHFIRKKLSISANFKYPEFTATACILTICLITALISSPNNWDVMTYHLPRVMHWIQNQSVAHYPTNNTRQISFPAGASYIVTQFQILAGNDLFANCLQWLAFLGSILGISLLTNILVGASSEWFGALVCVSVPMAIMQSTTTQTDLVVTFWLVCFTYFIFRTDNYTKLDIFWLAASIGLGISTKPTAIIIGFPLGIALLTRIVAHELKVRNQDCYKLNLIQVLVTIFIKIVPLLIFSLLLSMPNYWRNFQTFGSFLGDDGNSTKNSLLGIFPMISNILKNIAINFVFPGFWMVIENIHKYIIHVDINDPKLNSSDINKYVTLTGSLRFLSPNEDFVGSPIHLILFLIVVYILLANFLKNKKSNHDLQLDINTDSNILIKQEYPKVNHLLILSLTIIFGFLIHGFLIKWQPWGNRLILPLAVLTSVPITYLITHVFSDKARKILLILLTTISIIYALTTMRHPLIALPVLTAEQAKEQSASILFLQRRDMYFSSVHKELKIPYQAASDLVNQSQCKYVGLALGYDDIEYPFWTLLNRDLKIKNVNVKNSSMQAQAEFADLPLCAIISTMQDFLPNQVSNNPMNWQRINISQSPYLMVYRKTR